MHKKRPDINPVMARKKALQHRGSQPLVHGAHDAAGEEQHNDDVNNPEENDPSFEYPMDHEPINRPPPKKSWSIGRFLCRTPPDTPSVHRHTLRSQNPVAPTAK